MKWVMGIKRCTCDEHRVVYGTVQSLIQHCMVTILKLIKEKENLMKIKTIKILLPFSYGSRTNHDYTVQ